MYFLYVGAVTDNYMQFVMPSGKNAFAIDSTFNGGFEDLDDALGYMESDEESILSSLAVGAYGETGIIAIVPMIAPQNTLPFGFVLQAGCFFKRVVIQPEQPLPFDIPF